MPLELSEIVNFLNNNVGLLVGAGVPLLLLVAVTLTWMSGILASLDRLTFLRAGLVVLIESAVCLLATFIVVSSMIPDVGIVKAVCLLAPYPAPGPKTRGPRSLVSMLALAGRRPRFPARPDCLKKSAARRNCG